jgi:diguanylate cyclase (GGDEF)-like protein
LAAKFITLRDKLMTVGLGESEKTHLRKTLEKIRKTEPLQNEIVERLRFDTPTDVRNAISETDVPMETELLLEFDSLTEEIRLNGQKARSQARKDSINTLYISTLASGLVLISLFLLMRNSLYSLSNIEEELIDKTVTLDWAASHDHLTRTLNRRGLIHKMDQLQQSATAGSLHSLIYIDLDDFKPINDRFGHDVGDLFLCAIVNEFQTCIRKHDAIARIGGDEFALFLEECDPDTAMRIGRCLLDKVHGFTLRHAQQEIGISGCSIGLYTFTNRDAEIDTLLKCADTACYDSKRQGKNRITVYRS